MFIEKIQSYFVRLAGFTALCLMLSGGSFATTETKTNIAPIISLLLFEDENQPIDIKQLTSGEDHSCALLIDQTVRCWGSNEVGQLGNGAQIVSGQSARSNQPVLVIGIDNAVAIEAGVRHTCALLSTGAVKCWGDGQSGQLGNSGPRAISSLPVSVENVTNATAISAGSQHACVIVSGGRVKCWGGNFSGQLGDGTNKDNSAVNVIGISKAVSIAAGGYFACATLQTGRVKCWGMNSLGQLGVDTGNAFENEPVEISTIHIDGAVSIEAGSNHSCAVLEGGELKCWGRGDLGQIGNGFNNNASIPVSVVGIDAVKKVSVGANHTCAIEDNETVRCWGWNLFGQLGVNSISGNQNIPGLVSRVVDAVEVAAGGKHSCVSLSTGRVKCWGLNDRGQIGNLSFTNAPLADHVGRIRHAVNVGASERHTCAVLVDGKVECWGYNIRGQLGNGITNVLLVISGLPQSVLGVLDGALSVSAGGAATCVVNRLRQIECWGSNEFGQLGEFMEEYSTIPVPVPSGFQKQSLEVSVAEQHVCVLSTLGTVRCWGENDFGQLGNGSFEKSLTPVNVIGINNAVAIDVGARHSCALLADGNVKCWGANSSGQLGNSLTISNQSVLVVGVDNATSISSGLNNNCAVLNNRTVKCWGANGKGQIGNGSSGNPVLTATTVVDLTNVVDVAVGAEFGCALNISGLVSCWGGNDYGELGDGSPVGQARPFPESAPSGTATFIAAGLSHVCVGTTDGNISCWGRNNSGQLGSYFVGPPTNRPSSVF